MVVIDRLSEEMGKKKKAGKGKAGGKASNQPVAIELPPEPSTLTLLYRKASFDVRKEPLEGLLRIQYDKVSSFDVQPDAFGKPPLLKHHRAVIPGYCTYLKERNFWMTGDEIPEGAIPKPPVSEAAKTEKKGKKKK